MRALGGDPASRGSMGDAVESTLSPMRSPEHLTPHPGSMG